MSASSTPDHEVTGQAIVLKFERKLNEHEAMIGALDRGHKATNASIRTLTEKVDRAAASVEALSQQNGEVLQHISSVDGRLQGISTAMTTLANNTTSMSEDFRRHQSKCAERHTDLDVRLESLHDVEDVHDIDTGVFDAMSGTQVKALLEQETEARKVLEANVNKLTVQAQIHDAEKAAVAEAKKRWEEESTKTLQEQTKLKTARYTMYGVIITAILTSGAAVATTLITAGV